MIKYNEYNFYKYQGIQERFISSDNIFVNLNNWYKFYKTALWYLVKYDIDDAQ